MRTIAIVVLAIVLLSAGIACAKFESGGGSANDFTVRPPISVLPINPPPRLIIPTPLPSPTTTIIIPMPPPNTTITIPVKINKTLPGPNSTFNISLNLTPPKLNFTINPSPSAKNFTFNLTPIPPPNYTVNITPTTIRINVTPIVPSPPENLTVRPRPPIYIVPVAPILGASPVSNASASPVPAMSPKVIKIRRFKPVEVIASIRRFLALLPNSPGN